jgi:hypothetical protein
MALKSMSIAKLQDLKAKVDAAISEKVTTRRNELESELSKLDGHAGGGRRGRPAGHGNPGARWLPNSATPRTRPRPGQAVV